MLIGLLIPIAIFILQYIYAVIPRENANARWWFTFLVPHASFFFLLLVFHVIQAAFQIHQVGKREISKLRAEKKTCAEASKKMAILEMVYEQAKWLREEIEKLDRLFKQEGHHFEYPLSRKALPDLNDGPRWDYSFHQLREFRCMYLRHLELTEKQLGERRVCLFDFPGDQAYLDVRNMLESHQAACLVDLLAAKATISSIFQT